VDTRGEKFAVTMPAGRLGSALSGTDFDAAEYTDRAEAADALRDRLKAVMGSYETDPAEVMHLGGFPISAQVGYDNQGNKLIRIIAPGLPGDVATLRGLDLGGSGVSLLTRVENYLASLEAKRDEHARVALRLRAEVEVMRTRVGATFGDQAMLEALRKKAARVNEKIDREQKRRDMRKNGASEEDAANEYPFDPTIDTDQYDSPLLRTDPDAVGPPEAPATPPGTVPADPVTLSPGRRIQYVVDNATGASAVGQVVSVTVSGQFVFVVVRGQDGGEHTATYPLGASAVALPETKAAARRGLPTPAEMVATSARLFLAARR
jgi:hypothetical protein